MLNFIPKRIFRHWLLGALLCVCPVLMSGQLPGSPHQGSSPAEDNAPNPKKQHKQMATKDVEDKLKKGFDSKNAPYAGSNIQAAVDDQSITLSGTVTSESQHEMAKQLALAYAGDRKIVDKLVIR